MSKRILETLVRVAPVLPAAAVAAATPAAAEPKGEPDSKIQIQKHLAKYQKKQEVARIVSFELTPSVAKVGDTVTVKLTAENQTDLKIPALAYEITLPGGATKTGKLNLGPKKRGSVTTTFTAGSASSQRVSAVIDPQNSLKEPVGLRRDNSIELDLAVTSGSSAEWNGWALKAALRVRTMLQDEKSKLFFRRGKINGASFEVEGITLQGPGPQPHRTALKDDGMPDAVAKAFIEGTHKAIALWGNNYKGTFPDAFPMFIAWPGPSAPATSGIPAPLVIGGSTSGSEAISPQGIEQLVLAQLGSRRNEAGAAEAVRAFSLAASAAMKEFLTLTLLCPKGGGPVPTFAPPYVPVGPVVSGDNVGGPMICL